MQENLFSTILTVTGCPHPLTWRIANPGLVGIPVPLNERPGVKHDVESEAAVFTFRDDAG